MIIDEPQTFWISGEPPVQKTLATLMDGYSLSLLEHLPYSRETKSKPLRGGLATAVVNDRRRD